MDHESPASDEPPDWPAIVSGVLVEARRRAGKGPALALRLAQQGVVGERGEKYSESSVSNWIRQRARPPADVVLAAAKAVGISLDERLGIGREPTEVDRQLAEMARRLGELEGRLEGRTAPPAPSIAARPASLDDLQQAVGELETDLNGIGRQLRRPWEEPEHISYADPAASEPRRLARRVSLIEARHLEVASMLGTLHRGRPAQPDPAAGEEALLRWLTALVTLLREELPALRQRAAEVVRSRGDDRIGRSVDGADSA
jgi:hypothetical protein